MLSLGIHTTLLGLISPEAASDSTTENAIHALVNIASEGSEARVEIIKEGGIQAICNYTKLKTLLPAAIFNVISWFWRVICRSVAILPESVVFSVFYEVLGMVNLQEVVEESSVDLGKITFGIYAF